MAEVDYPLRLKQTLAALQKMRAKVDSLQQARTEPIAVIGMACRFPGGVTSPASYWELLRNGVDAIRDIPADRWDIEQYYDPDPDAPGKMYIRQGGFIENVDQFDPQFFGISPREAIRLDPQQRLFLEVAWEALEHAGLAPAVMKGSQTGVFVGVTGMDYMQLQFQRTPLPEIDAYFTTGNILNAVAGRVAYTLGFHGPTLAIDTACSSSLTAVHIACQNLRAGETNMAIAGGVNLVLLPEALVSFCRWGMLAPDARCKTFDDRADGFIRGEGCGAVILKRLSDALAEGDNIMALILGSAANQDGPSSGFSVPNGLAQQAVIRQALTNAGVEPLAVDYVEAHGTGTSLGDPIEVEALGSALCQERPADQPLTIGSVKTNIGHTEAASGIAGLMKVVLALQHQEIPPHLHLQERSHRIDWEQWPIEIATERKAWPRSARPRIAGVSGFGFSGNNVHIVLGEAPERPRGAPTLERPYHLLTLSAKSEDALQALARDYVGFLSAQPEISLADLCFTANSGRSHFSYRLALTAESSSEIRDKLAAFAGAQPLSDASVKGLVYGAAQNHQPHKVVFLFSGQGAQSVGMGRELYTHSPTFRQVMDECDALLRPHLPHSLLAVLYGDDPAITALLDETAYTQPALFAVEYALATLWQSWGIRPAAVMGHSVGEYVAACVAGVMSLGDGLRLIAQRGRLMQSLPKNGAMVAVFAPAHVVTDAIGPLADQVSIAAYNAPSSIVISGSKESVETVVERLKKQKIKTHELAVSHAFHSPLMEPILDEFTAVVKQATFATPQLRFISNLTGQAASSELTTPEYWVRHLRQPVRFAQGMTSLLEGQYDCFVEIGPKPVLLGLARQSLQEDLGVWLPSLRLEKPEFEQMLHSLGELYVRGLPVDWPQVDGPYAQGKLRLPTYPFQRQRYWLESTQPRPIHRTFSRVEGLEHPLLGSRLQTAGTETIFENQVAMDSPAFLGDHRIFGNVVVPATAYLEMALAGARLTLGMDCIQLADVAVHQALIVAGESRPTIQLIVAPESDGITPFRILSLAENAQDSGAKWRLHASGKFSRGQTSVEVSTPLEAIQQRCSVELLGGLDYEQLRLQGIEFGPTFRGVERLWKNAQSTEMLGQVRLPEAAAASGGYHLHPALLDACLQTATVLKPVSTPDASSVVYLPLTLEHLHFYRQPSTQLWCHARLQSARSVEGERLVADFRLFDARGEVVADLVGLHFKRADAETLRRSVQKSIHANVDEWFHEIVWRPKALAAPEVKPPATSGCWLIFRDGKGVGAALVQRLAELGEANIQLLPGSHYAAIDPAAGIWQLNPAEPSHYDRLLAEPLLANGPALRGIVHLWSLDTPPSETLDARQILTWQALNCGSVLNLVQALSRLDQASGCKVCLVTAGVQPVPEAMAVAQGCEVAQAPLWGLGQTVALEYPQMTCLRVDLDPSAVLSAATDAVQPLLAEIWSTDGEDQVALRGQGRYVARLVRQSSPAPEPQTVLDEQPVRLDITERGVLDNLILLPSARRQPEAGEVEIRVRATGLNFRDVLKALGMYPGDTGPLGDECAGEVVAVGPGVERFQVGDKVFGIIPGAFATYVCARVEFITHMPESLDFEEAATIPIVFLTAHYALNHLAQMQPGESVLIHAAAGGVGMAAVQLAQRVGAVIFATAGSPDKRAYLHSLGVAHVLDSRSLAFAEEIRQLTGGEGVDIVLNSLNGDFIPHNLAVLKEQGRFLEIGKIGIWSREQIAAVKPQVRYFPIFLGEQMEREPELIQALLQAVAADLDSGALQPLPRRVYPLAEAAHAFRFMAQAKHIGKLVVTQPHLPSSATPTTIRADATYLITGGLGGLGLVCAKWLVVQGARHLVLLGRSGGSVEAQAQVAQLAAAGVQVVVAQADVSQAEDVRRVLATIDESMPPLRGLIHAAGVLDDGMLAQQDWSRFEQVMAPKVQGAWHLHQLTQERELDFFVLFSAGAVLLGALGQGNYVAANSFLDLLAHRRRARGLAGMSINWGPWAEVGMAASLSSRDQQRFARVGVGSMTPAEGIEALQMLIASAAAQVGVLPVRWSTYLAALEKDRPLFAELQQQVEAEKQSKQPISQELSLLQRLAETHPSKQRNLLISYISDATRSVLQMGPTRSIHVQQPLSEMGLDSLMALELRNVLSRGIHEDLPATLLFDYPTIAALAEYLGREVLMLIPGGITAEPEVESLSKLSPASGQKAAPQTVAYEQSVADVASLSDDEAASLLLAELDGSS